MEPERDVITNGRERRVPLPRTRDEARPAAPWTAAWRSARSRWVWLVAAVLALVAPTVYVATRPDGGADPVAGPRATASRTPRQANRAPSFAPPPQPDNRPEAFPAQSLYADAQRALGPTGQAGATEIELLGSDYRGGQDTVGVFGQQIHGTVNVDLACAGTGTASVWIQDPGGGSDAGPPTVLDCANPRPARLTSSISGSDFFVYAKLDPNTVAVLAYLPSISISVEDHGF